MSKEVLEQVVLKASSDARFRAQMNDNFDAALRPYDLSPAEKAKLRSGIVGLSDEREVRRTMAASQASSVAASSQAASATAGTVDVGTVDVGTVDVGTVDVGTVDVGTVDVGTVDVGTVDVGTVDAGSTLTS
jgi:hypothetical protein